MYEGKNIHFSPLDNKPLCSYSAKVCKQRRLNGYSLCLRHVLEDPGAPFRQCLYQARNKQQCTNPIHKNNDAQFCTSHLQLLGLIPVGVKSCSKANREGKLIKNGLHGTGSPCQKDQLRNKTKTCDNIISRTETQSAGSDPYTFSDVDPPKTSKSSPPLLSMVADADVSGMHSCLTAICSVGTKPAMPQEPHRSIPISRLYPELVEKLESDRNKSHPRPKVMRSLRTASTPASRNSHNRIKLKKCSSPSGVMSAVDSAELLVPASCLSTLMNQSGVLSASPSTSTSTVLSTPVYNSLGTKQDVTDEKMAVSNNSSEMKNPAVISRSPWMLPMFEHPLVSQQTVPVMPSFSKALHGLLNPLPLLKSSAQSPLTSSGMPQSTVAHPLFRSQSEPQRPPEKGLSLHQTPTITSSAVSQRLASLDLKLAGTLVSAPSLGLLRVNQRGSALPETTSASNSQPSAAVAAETMSNFIKIIPTSNSDDAQSGSDSRIIHLVRPRSKAHRFSYKDAKSRISRKCALKIYVDHTARVVENSNLLPTGVDSSDDDDDLDHELPWQRLWNDLSSDEGEGDFDLSEDITSNIRRTKLQLLKSKMRRQFTQLQRCHEGNACVRTHHRASIDYLIASCRQDSQATVEALRSINNMKLSNSSLDRSSDMHRLHKRPCLHRNDCDVVCNSVALPYTNHCLKHIMYNVDQLLFGYCTAKFADKTQCCVPVFDIKHELPLCSDHMTKDIIQESQEMKPKKQRKKTKPSALTRPPKKGKKKKCQRKTVQKQPQKPLLTLDSCPTSSVDVSPHDGARPVVDPAAQSSVSSSSSLSISARTSRLDSSAATGACTMLSSESKDSIDDDALGSDLDVTFSPTGLPLDNDQGTNFLDEHELHEMLNKMADEAFELSAGKNGCYPSSKEVEEEFVRVLVEATKNLSESKDRLEQMSHEEDHTLATLLPDGPNEDELTKQIADSLLNRTTLSPSGSVSDDQDNLNDLASSLTVHDLRSISQVMESSIISHALDLCPTGVTVPPTLHHNEGVPNNCINYLNGSGLLQQYPAQEQHPLGTVSGTFSPMVDQSQLGPVNTHVRFPGLISFPLTSNGMLDSGLATPSHLNATMTAPRFPSVLSSMLPLAALGMSSSRVVVSLSHGITSSQTMRPPATSYSGDDSFGQMTTFHSLPDIQTLIKQPWRISAGDGLVSPEFRPNLATFSTTSVPVNFPNSQFSYIPNFHPPQFLVSESKTSSVLPKTEPESIQTTRTALPETNAAADLLCSANSALSSLHKVFNPQMPSTP